MTKTSLAVTILLALTLAASAQSNPQTSANEMLPGCKGLISDKTPPFKGSAEARALCWICCRPCICEVGLFVCAGRGDAGAGGTRRHQVYRGKTGEDARAFGKLALEALEEAWPCKR